MERIGRCARRYEYWKKIALSTSDERRRIDSMKKAFFWLELCSAFLLLKIAEDRGKDMTKAKVRISEKLAKYAEEILKEI